MLPLVKIQLLRQHFLIWTCVGYVYLLANLLVISKLLEYSLEKSWHLFIYFSQTVSVKSKMDALCNEDRENRLKRQTSLRYFNFKPPGRDRFEIIFLISSSILMIFQSLLYWIQYDHSRITSQIANDSISLLSTIRKVQNLLFTMNTHRKMYLNSYWTWSTFQQSTGFLRIPIIFTINNILSALVIFFLNFSPLNSSYWLLLMYIR